MPRLKCELDRRNRNDGVAIEFSSASARRIGAFIVASIRLSAKYYATLRDPTSGGHKRCVTIVASFYAKPNRGRGSLEMRNSSFS